MICVDCIFCSLAMWVAEKRYLDCGEKISLLQVMFKVAQDPCSLINSLAKFLNGVLSCKALFSEF